MIDGESVRPKPSVLIFRNELLPASETFIRAQAGALKVFDARFAGVHVAERSLELPGSALLLDASLGDGAAGLLGKVRRRVYWRTSFAPKFYRSVEDAGACLLHAHFAVDGAAALPVARRMKVPFVVTLHGYDVMSSEETLRRSAEGRLYLRRREQLWDQAALFLCISKFLYEQALARGFPREKLRVHYTGTNLDQFRVSSKERDPNLIVFVGRLVEKKGCLHLLDALERVRRDHPEARVVCIGAGPLRGALEARAKVSDLPCTFVGAQPSEVVREYLSRARVFCVPSVRAASGDSEGLGMVFAEAQAMGTPVVSSQHGGIPEVVLHEHTGLLAPEGDSAMLAQYLLMLLRDDERWGRYSQAGLEWVRERFDLERQTRELEEIYREILRNNI